MNKTILSTIFFLCVGCGAPGEKGNPVINGSNPLDNHAVGASISVFDLAYTDKDGMEWSHTLPAKFSNGCVDINGKFDESQCSKSISNSKDSAAEAACEALGEGVRLPTYNEYKNLIKSFSFRESNTCLPPFSPCWAIYLTDKGFTDMKAAFDNDFADRDFFWSSDVYEKNPTDANSLMFDPLYFDGEPSDGIFYSEARRDSNFIRCVRDKAHK